MEGISNLRAVRLILTFVLLFAGLALPAQEADTTETREGGSFFGVPIIFLTPETSLGFGGGAIYAFRFPGEPAESRPSQFQLGGAYTLERQLLSYLPFQLFFEEEKWNLYGELGYYQYTYFYYGNDLENYDGELYDVKFPRLRFNALYLADKQLYVGLRYWMDNFSISNVEEGGLLDSLAITGRNGGLVSSLGPVASFDQRDNIFYPTKGWFVEAAVLFNGEKAGSPFRYTKLTIDARKYLQNNWGHVLALNLYSEANFGDPPFNQLALIGGNKRMRGYYEGRFRGKHGLIAQAEYRFPLIWRIGGALFGAYGGVAGQYSRFSLDDFRYTLGAGLRVLLLKKERVHIRVDYGFGKNTSGLYITIGEAF